MRAVIQRVSSATVTMEGGKNAKIGTGFMILLGIEDADNEEDITWLCKKIAGLRVFGDDTGRMNLSIRDIEGEMLIVSQFTLHASTRKGNRPSFIRAARPDVAIPLYKQFISQMRDITGKEVQTGEFGAYMQISLVNDGPVTILMDSKNKE